MSVPNTKSKTLRLASSTRVRSVLMYIDVTRDPKEWPRASEIVSLGMPRRKAMVAQEWRA